MYETRRSGVGWGERVKDKYSKECVRLFRVSTIYFSPVLLIASLQTKQSLINSMCEKRLQEVSRSAKINDSNKIMYREPSLQRHRLFPNMLQLK